MAAARREGFHFQGVLALPAGILSSDGGDANSRYSALTPKLRTDSTEPTARNLGERESSRFTADVLPGQQPDAQWCYHSR